jgi:hypothetical protein
MSVETPMPPTPEAVPAKSLRGDLDISEDGVKLIDRANRMGGQLRNWVMAGNAGGIAFILTTRRELEATAPFSLAPAYTGLTFRPASPLCAPWLDLRLQFFAA